MPAPTTRQSVVIGSAAIRTPCAAARAVCTGGAHAGGVTSSPLEKCCPSESSMALRVAAADRVGDLRAEDLPKCATGDAPLLDWPTGRWPMLSPKA
eukprot:1221144-Prymnesium_polylepis.2